MVFYIPLSRKEHCLGTQGGEGPAYPVPRPLDICRAPRLSPVDGFRGLLLRRVTTPVGQEVPRVGVAQARRVVGRVYVLGALPRRRAPAGAVAPRLLPGPHRRSRPLVAPPPEDGGRPWRSEGGRDSLLPRHHALDAVHGPPRLRPDGRDDLPVRGLGPGLGGPRRRGREAPQGSEGRRRVPRLTDTAVTAVVARAATRPQVRGTEPLGRVPPPPVGAGVRDAVRGHPLQVRGGPHGHLLLTVVDVEVAVSGVVVVGLVIPEWAAVGAAVGRLEEVVLPVLL